MFDRIKKLFRANPNQIIAASWDYELPRYTFVYSKSVSPIRVLESDKVKAMDLLANIEYAKRQKKKHSHLLAELKALEVK